MDSFLKTIENMRFWLLILSQLVVFVLASCNNTSDNQDDKVIPIVSELPAFYQGCNLYEGETALITNQDGFDTVFIVDQISQILSLQNIDLLKYDILIGADSFTHGIYKIEYTFLETEINIYLLKVNVIYDDTLPAGTFYYGIIINKLPSGSTFNIEINKVYN